MNTSTDDIMKYTREEWIDKKSKVMSTIDYTSTFGMKSRPTGNPKH